MQSKGNKKKEEGEFAAEPPGYKSIARVAARTIPPKAIVAIDLGEIATLFRQAIKKILLGRMIELYMNVGELLSASFTIFCTKYGFSEYRPIFTQIFEAGRYPYNNPEYLATLIEDSGKINFKRLSSLKAHLENLKNLTPFDRFEHVTSLLALKFEKVLYDVHIINDFLKVALFDNETVIFVNNEAFSQCKYLLLNISPPDIPRLSKIDSIDEAAEKLDHSLEVSDDPREKFCIDPHTEFIGHCSNLQAWAEYDYDTRILHSNLSFPLLKRLAEVGDPKAKKYFKREVIERFNSNYPSVMRSILESDCFIVFSQEELRVLISDLYAKKRSIALGLLEEYGLMEYSNNYPFAWKVMDLIQSLDFGIYSYQIFEPVFERSLSFSDERRIESILIAAQNGLTIPNLSIELYALLLGFRVRILDGLLFKKEKADLSTGYNLPCNEASVLNIFLFLLSQGELDACNRLIDTPYFKKWFSEAEGFYYYIDLEGLKTLEIDELRVHRGVQEFISQNPCRETAFLTAMIWEALKYGPGPYFQEKLLDFGYVWSSTLESFRYDKRSEAELLDDFVAYKKFFRRFRDAFYRAHLLQGYPLSRLHEDSGENICLLLEVFLSSLNAPQALSTLFNEWYHRSHVGSAKFLNKVKRVDPSWVHQLSELSDLQITNRLKHTTLLLRGVLW